MCNLTNRIMLHGRFGDNIQHMALHYLSETTLIIKRDLDTNLLKSYSSEISSFGEINLNNKFIFIFIICIKWTFNSYMYEVCFSMRPSHTIVFIYKMGISVNHLILALRLGLVPYSFILFCLFILNLFTLRKKNFN